MESDNQTPPTSNSQPNTSGAQPPPQSSQLPDGSDPLAPVTPPSDQQPSGSKNKKMLIVAFIAALALILGGVLLFAAQGSKNTEDNSDTQANTTQNSTANETPPASSNTEPQSGEVNIDIKDFAFTPEKITVKKGSKVIWTNQDSAQHNVVSDDDSPMKGLDGPLLAKGKTFSFTFDKIGVYNYHCEPHPNMVGTIEVVE